jgi:hypothetical protein
VSQDPHSARLAVHNNHGTGPYVAGDVHGTLIQQVVNKATRNDLSTIARISPRLATALEQAVRDGAVSAEFVNTMAHVTHALNMDVAGLFVYAADRINPDVANLLVGVADRISPLLASQLSSAASDLDGSATRFEQSVTRIELALSSVSLPDAQPAAQAAKPRVSVTNAPTKVLGPSVVTLSYKDALISALCLFGVGLLAGVLMVVWIVHRH